MKVIFLSKFEWNDYFTSSPVTTVSSSKYSSRLSYSSGNIYVLDCLFSTITSTSNGGALYCSSVSCLLIESSSFFTCKTSSQYAGAIYFSNTGSGQSVLHGVCGYDCYSTYTSGPYNQFARIEANYGTISHKNYMNYSSVSHCISEISGSYYTFRLYGGKVCCQSVNSSMNKCQYYPGFYSCTTGDSNSVTCSFLYSSFLDNNAFGYTCIYFNNRGTKNEMKCCNVLRNTQGTSSCGIIYADANLMIEDSCILENEATNIFFSGSSSYIITLSNCTVDKTTNNGYLTTQSTVTKSFILALNHISTRNCHSEYDSAGYLTAFTTKKIFCYTYKICNRQAIISDFFSLVFVFKVVFIQSNPYE
jgi:hypothetical protein